MAFDRWEEISNLKFENVQNPYRKKPDITITVIRKNHNFRADCQGTSKCPHNFDGPGKVLAHAYFPNENNKCVEIHLDAEEKWYLGNSTSPDGQTNLLMVLIHEIGHALGLGHSGVNTAIMYPWYQASPASFDIDDKRAIEYLYGQKTENYQPTTTSTTQTTESQKPISQHTSTTASSVSSNEPHNVDVTSTTSKPQITPTRLCDIQVPDFMFLATAPQFQNYRMYVGYNRFLWKFDLNDMRIPPQPELLDDYLPEDLKSSRVSHVFQNSDILGTPFVLKAENIGQASKHETVDGGGINLPSIDLRPPEYAVVASYFYVKNHPTNGDWCLHSPPKFKAISVSTPLHAQGQPRSGSMRTAAGPFRPLRRPTSSHAQDHPRPRSLTSLRRRCGAVTCSRPPTFEVAASLRRVFSDPFEGPHRLTLKTTHVQGH
ncbi:unnamed protein product [Phaedon cochleariae]|uniref:Peptidase metallopeptidase domain-containing protein n=1 Tax=Phaedon cochleariae TaxID=80249 RepID=A0A9N9SE17_PHACE|nr:unnamed protein product [Phaedon cochleariae]